MHRLDWLKTRNWRMFAAGGSAMLLFWHLSLSEFGKAFSLPCSS